MFKKRLGLFFIIAVLVVSLVGCGSSDAGTTPIENQDKNNESKAEVNVDGYITITGLKKDEKVSVKEIFEMESAEVETESVKSSGEVLKNKIKGVYLKDILNKFNTKEENYTGIQMIAGDGYSIVAPKEILEKRDILLVYEIDGEALSPKAQPFMSAIPNERSMYWVKNLAEVELLTEEVLELKNLVILESAIKKMEQSDYTYYEATDKAVRVEELLSNYTGDLDKKSAIIRAADGLEKEEDIKVLTSGYLKITGKDTPLFLSPELPKGMHVKDILSIEYKDSVIISMNKVEGILIDGEDKSKGIALDKLIELSGMKTGKVYNLVAEDGYEIEITADQVDKGYIYEKDGKQILDFDGLEKQYTIKGLEKIVCVK